MFLVLTAATAIVPVSVHIVMLGVVMFFMGMTLGGLDNGRYLQEEEYSKVQCTTINVMLFVAGNCSP